jgi:hypothetical protein
MATFNNGQKIVACVVADEGKSGDGVVTVFAAEGDSNDVKEFQARKSSGGEADYERA